MKKIIRVSKIFILLLLGLNQVNGQQNNCTGIYDGSLDCSMPVVLCEYPYRYKYDNQRLNCSGDKQHLWHKFTVSSTGFALEVEDAVTPFLYANVYGPFTSLDNSVCLGIASGSITPQQSITMSSNITTISIPNGIGEYLLEIIDYDCYGCLTFTLKDGSSYCDNDTIVPLDEPCETCIGSFAPTPGAKYLISAWAKEEISSATSYVDPEVVVEFLDASGTILSGTTQQFSPSGELIEGWQRIEQEFVVPMATVRLRIMLTTKNKPVLFDDVRVLPFNGSMKSYVYDPVNMRLAAELDERHFSTFYEYDEEGNLTRIKKETERGVMTIQESKSNTSK